jgi:hypothetical protein
MSPEGSIGLEMGDLRKRSKALGRGRPKVLTADQESDACRRYEAGQSIRQICIAFMVSDTPVENALLAGGVALRPRCGVSEAERDLLGVRYSKGESAPDLAREVGVSDQSVLRWLKARGIARRTNSQAQTRYTLHHDYFDAIDAPEKAYWLGFLAADGCVKPCGDLCVSLAERDRPHVECLARTLGSDRPIPHRTDNGRPMAYFTVRSHQMTAALTSHGVVPAKTFRLEWPDLPNPLRPHFVRGYVDGDGGFYFHQTRHPCGWHGFSVTGFDGFIHCLQDYLMARCRLGRTKLHYRRPGKPIATLSYGGRQQVARIAGLLYSDATVFLERKWAAVEDLLRI